MYTKNVSNNVNLPKSRNSKDVIAIELFDWWMCYCHVFNVSDSNEMVMFFSKLTEYWKVYKPRVTRCTSLTIGYYAERYQINSIVTSLDVEANQRYVGACKYKQ